METDQNQRGRALKPKKSRALNGAVRKFNPQRKLSSRNALPQAAIKQLTVVHLEISP